MTRPLLPLWAALLTAAAAGPVLDAGFPDRYLWPLTLVGIALVLSALIGRGSWSAFLVGLVSGLSFYFTHIAWATEFLGEVLPMVALVTLESLFFAVGSVLIMLAYRWLPRVWSTPMARLSVVPLVVAGLWTAREGLVSVWPYGGFAWGRVSLSQSEGPLAELFPWLGVSGVSFVMVGFVALVVEAVRAAEPRRLVVAAAEPRRLTTATALVAIATGLMAMPGFAAPGEGSIRVVAVQGNGKAAYLDQREYGDLLRAQLEATLAVEEQSADVVLWPEGATEIDPTEDASAARTFDRIAERFDAQLISGAITTEGETTWNSSLLWRPGEGAVDKYDKRHPVPFGEYIPDRAFWRPFAPELIDLVQREYTPGVTDAVFDLGDVTVGVNICFDIVDDGLMTESVRDGAQVIFAQSNNADFGRTDESVQQLAIARVRALELGRAVVNISTVGTSAIILADGSTLDELEWYTAGAMVADVPISSAVTPAVAAGRQLELLVSGYGLVMLVLAGIAVRRRRG